MMRKSSRGQSTQQPVVVAITGASGAIYSVRLLQALLGTELDIHLTISVSGAAVIRQELQLDVDVRNPDLAALVGYVPPWGQSDAARSATERAVAQIENRIRFHHYNDYFTPIASGSFRTHAMIICPCSGSTLSGIARSAASNLIQRAAEVHLKEQRKLVLVPRETPLSVLQLENMHRLAAAGAVILPAMPGWYHGVETLDSIVDFIVSRILDQLDIENQLMDRWGE